MEITHRTAGKARHVALLLTLGTGCLLLTGLLSVTLEGYPEAGPQTRRILLVLAWTAAGLLFLTLLLLMWVFIRWMRSRMPPPRRREGVGYVNAWVEAGRRLQTSDARTVDVLEEDEPIENLDDQDEDDDPASYDPENGFRDEELDDGDEDRDDAPPRC
jgi:hypothetical protein